MRAIYEQAFAAFLQLSDMSGQHMAADAAGWIETRELRTKIDLAILECGGAMALAVAPESNFGLERAQLAMSRCELGIELVYLTMSDNDAEAMSVVESYND